MGRPPIGKVAMTATERSHRYRAKLREAQPATKRNETSGAGLREQLRQVNRENATLRARLAALESASASKPTQAAADGTVAKLQARIAKLESDMAEREQTMLMRQWASEITIDPGLQRVLMGMVHPDAVQHPEAKAQLGKISATLNAAINDVRKHAKRREERRQKAAAEREKRSQRSKEAHARRKAKAAE
jgi:hypothetical protein